MKKLAPFITLIIGLIAWQAIIECSKIPPYLLPSPLAVWQRALSKHESLLSAFSLTGLAAMSGFLLSLIIGFCSALAFASSRWLERGLFPYAIFFQTVPIVAISPLIILWVGQGLVGIITVAFIISIFPIVSNTTTGLTRCPKLQRELFELHSASKWQTLIKLQIPNAMPHLLAGARVSSGLSVIGAIVGEFSAGFGSDHFGLGYLILFSSGQLKTDLLFACIIMSTLLGFLVFSFVHHGGSWLLKTFHLESSQHIDASTT